MGTRPHSAWRVHRSLTLLLQCQQELGERDGVNDTMQRLLFFDPESPTLQAALLTMSEPIADRLRKNSSWEEAEGSLTTQYLSREDKVTLEALLDAQVQSLPSAFLPVLSALTIFPDSFTEKQAKEIVHASPSELERFRSALLLSRDGEERFRMPEPIRQILWRKLTGEQTSSPPCTVCRLVCYLGEWACLWNSGFQQRRRRFCILGERSGAFGEVPSLDTSATNLRSRRSLYCQYLGTMSERHSKIPRI